MIYYVYLLVSLKNGKSYVGYTEKHPIERLEEHNRGSNQWTSINKPFSLKYFESFICKTDALRREKFLKSGTGEKLVNLIVEHF